MGITIHLQDQRGNAIESIADERNLLHTLLPPTDDPQFRALSRIDWYGDTTFNRMQMEDVIREFGELAERPLSSGEREIMSEIVRLAQQGIQVPHLYLRFCGD